MTRLAVLALLAIASNPATAETPRQLTGAEIGSVTGASLGALRACYVEHGARTRTATGRVEIDLIVHRDGHPFRISVATPGVKSARLSRCVRSVAERWRFPKRRGFTHTVVPFLFLRTHAEGAGPAHSCWKARGCKTPAPPPSVRDEGPRLSKQAD